MSHLNDQSPPEESGNDPSGRGTLHNPAEPEVTKPAEELQKQDYRAKLQKKLKERKRVAKSKR
jgi:hypothetical protein